MIKGWLARRAARKAEAWVNEEHYREAFEFAVSEIGERPLSETKINEYTDVQEWAFIVSAASLGRDAWDRFFYYMRDQYGEDAWQFHDRFEKDLEAWDRARSA